MDNFEDVICMDLDDLRKADNSIVILKTAIECDNVEAVKALLPLYNGSYADLIHIALHGYHPAKHLCSREVSSKTLKYLISICDNFYTFILCVQIPVDILKIIKSYASPRKIIYQIDPYFHYGSFDQICHLIHPHAFIKTRMARYLQGSSVIFDVIYQNMPDKLQMLFDNGFSRKDKYWLYIYIDHKYKRKLYTIDEYAKMIKCSSEILEVIKKN
jgi:hypothetical protein